MTGGMFCLLFASILMLFDAISMLQHGETVEWYRRIATAGVAALIGIGLNLARDKDETRR